MICPFFWPLFETLVGAQPEGGGVHAILASVVRAPVECRGGSFALANAVVELGPGDAGRARGLADALLDRAVGPAVESGSNREKGLPNRQTL